MQIVYLSLLGQDISIALARISLGGLALSLEKKQQQRYLIWPCDGCFKHSLFSRIKIVEYNMRNGQQTNF